MNETQKQALTLVLEMAEQVQITTGNARDVSLLSKAVAQSEALYVVRQMIKPAPEPEPLLDTISGPITVIDFWNQTQPSMAAAQAVSSGFIKFSRGGSPMMTVSNVAGTFQPGDYVTVSTKAGKTYAISA